MVENYKEIQGLKVFSKKIGGPMELCAVNGAIRETGCLFQRDWSDQGWNNSSDGWMDNGWNNSSEGWMDSGWNNSSDRWSDSGWSNSGDSWSDGGWNNSGDGCYLTTACVEYMGLGDQCDELETLRHYRDVLVEEDQGFRKAVLEYYRKAPIIVQKIMKSGKKEEILDFLYHELVQKCVSLLKKGEMENAKQHYLAIYHKLEKEFSCC